MIHAFTLNGGTTEVEAPAMMPLLRVLRDSLGLRGSKLGCGEGRCGACTILIDGDPVVSCIYPVVLAAGREVTTIEGLAGPEDPLTPLQDSLLEYGAVQCGACIPGVIMSLTAALDSDTKLDEAAVKDALSGNICRCTGYRKIVRAALAVATGRETSGGCSPDQEGDR